MAASGSAAPRPSARGMRYFIQILVSIGRTTADSLEPVWPIIGTTRPASEVRRAVVSPAVVFQPQGMDVVGAVLVVVVIDREGRPRQAVPVRFAHRRAPRPG